MTQRLPIAICPQELPPLPTEPHPAPSPLQQFVGTTVSKTDYDAVCLPLANPLWQDRWERLCLRPVDEEDASLLDAGGSTDASHPRPSYSVDRIPERTDTDREADLWRKDPSLNRQECNITRLEESQGVIALASEWLELDAQDEGIRFDSELVSTVEVRKC